MKVAFFVYGCLTTLVIALIGGVSFYNQYYYEWPNQVHERAKILCDDRCQNDNLMVNKLQLANLGLVAAVEEYVPRPEFENIIRSYTRTVEISAYMVVAGPKGCGKSTVVQAALRNVTGVIPVELTTDALEKDIFSQILSALGGVGISKLEAREKFHEITNRAAKALNSPNWKPTVVFEISGKSTDVLGVDAVCRLAKKITTDTQSAHAIIVLSDANAAFGVPANDRPRQKMVWIEDFTIEEAHQFFDYRNFLKPVNESDNIQLRQRIFNQVGTRPYSLEKFATAKLDTAIDTMLESALSNAAGQLRSLFSVRNSELSLAGPAFEQLVRQLLQSPNQQLNFIKTLSYLSEPSLVAKVLKEGNRHAILFHYPSLTPR